MDIERDIDNIDIDTINYKARRKIYFIIKRLFDIFGGIIGCILLIPITIILKICFIISKDFEPIIFS